MHERSANKHRVNANLSFQNAADGRSASGCMFSACVVVNLWSELDANTEKWGNSEWENGSDQTRQNKRLNLSRSGYETSHTHTPEPVKSVKELLNNVR